MSGRPGRDAHAPLLVFYALRTVSAIPILVSLYTSSSFTRFAWCFVLWLVLSVLYRFSDAYAPEKKRRIALIAIGIGFSALHWFGFSAGPFQYLLLLGSHTAFVRLATDVVTHRSPSTAPFQYALPNREATFFILCGTILHYMNRIIFALSNLTWQTAIIQLVVLVGLVAVTVVVFIPFSNGEPLRQRFRTVETGLMVMTIAWLAMIALASIFPGDPVAGQHKVQLPVAGTAAQEPLLTTAGDSNVEKANIMESNTQPVTQPLGHPVAEKATKPSATSATEPAVPVPETPEASSEPALVDSTPKWSLIDSFFAHFSGVINNYTAELKTLGFGSLLCSLVAFWINFVQGRLSVV